MDDLMMAWVALVIVIMGGMVLWAWGQK